MGRGPKARGRLPVDNCEFDGNPNGPDAGRGPTTHSVSCRILAPVCGGADREIRPFLTADASSGCITVVLLLDRSENRCSRNRSSACDVPQSTSSHSGRSVLEDGPRESCVAVETDESPLDRQSSAQDRMERSSHNHRTRALSCPGALGTGQKLYELVLMLEMVTGMRSTPSASL